MSDEQPAPALPAEPPAESEGLRTLTHVLYALYAIFWMTGGATALVAIIVNYVKRDDVRGTLCESHFTWQIRSFWWSAGWTVFGGLLFATVVLMPLAFAVWAGLSLWMLYRIVKGWLYLYDGKAMYQDRTV